MTKEERALLLMAAEIVLSHHNSSGPGMNPERVRLRDAIKAVRSAEQPRCPATQQVFEIVLASLNYDGQDIDSLTVGEIRRALP